MYDLDELTTWFINRPKWSQEAVRRLVQNGNLTDTDLDELFDLCKNEDKISPLIKKNDFNLSVFSASSSESLRICSIGNIQGINALAPKKPLEFSNNNISIVYGKNGSGKSGYVRILKHICGARNIGTLHPNIFLGKNEEKSCSISYEKNNAIKTIQWTFSSGAIEDLRSIDIFDSLCGSMYLTNESQVTYEPPLLALFSELVATCDKLNLRLNKEISSNPSKKPILPIELSTTDAGKWYNQLKYCTPTLEVNKHCSWNENDSKRLVGVNNRLAESSPVDKAKKLRNQKTHIDTLIESTKGFFKKISDSQHQIILNLKSDSKQKQEATELAANKLFSDAPLDGVGSTLWQELWGKAREYSNKQVYISEEYPFVGEDARCVLCEQPLDDKAKIRLQSLETFIKGELKNAASLAQRKYDESLQNLGEITSIETLQVKLDAAEITEPDIVDKIIETYQILQKRKEKISKAEPILKLDMLPSSEVKWIQALESDGGDKTESMTKEFPDSWLAELNKWSSKCEEDAKLYDADAKSDNREELKTKQLELKIRKWLSEQKKSVEDEISRLKIIHKLQETQKLVNTGIYSIKKGSLAETLITETFVKRFNSELKELGTKNIKVELVKTRTDKGKVLHQVRLKGVKGYPIEEILSEGEYRIVCLAAFLADVEKKSSISPFVFDDPISSLDQDYEEAMVRKLIDMAKERQVIVFTHRLSLLGLIEYYSDKTGLTSDNTYVRYESWGAGEPGITPLFAKQPINALNTILNARIPEAKKLLNDKGIDAYEPHAKSICIDFRILIERFIENYLLADVVKRNRRAITTIGKIDKLAKINDADCKYLDELMSKYSIYQHSQSEETPVDLPEPDDITKDMEGLISWYKEFKNR